MVRKNSRFGGGDEEEDEGGNWLDSYSDLVTDLMAIFVVLFSFAAMMVSATVAQYESDAKGKEGAQARTAYALSEGKEVLKNSTPASTSENEVIKEPEENESLRNLKEQINDYIDEEELSDYLSVSQQDENTVLLRVSTSVLFNTADADITPEAQMILDGIAGLFDEYAEVIKVISVEGHADTRPIHGSVYSNNWQLSSARAATVVEYLLEGSDLLPEQLSAVGHAEFQPIADNSTEEGMAQNRRVDFIIKINQPDSE